MNSSIGAVGTQVQVFPSTHWSIVLATRDSQDTWAMTALETLCRAYWYPLYAFIRQQEGSESPPFPFHTVERLIFEKVLEETLSQVLGSVVMGSDRD